MCMRFSWGSSTLLPAINDLHDGGTVAVASTSFLTTPLLQLLYGMTTRMR